MTDFFLQCSVRQHSFVWDVMQVFYLAKTVHWGIIFRGRSGLTWAVICPGWWMAACSVTHNHFRTSTPAKQTPSKLYGTYTHIYSSALPKSSESWPRLSFHLSKNMKMKLRVHSYLTHKVKQHNYIFCRFFSVNKISLLKIYRLQGASRQNNGKPNL